MEEAWNSRTKRVIGEEAAALLSEKRVAVFGLGGVGGAVVEALARAGVGALDLVDNDTVALSNINRQLIATLDTVGMEKTEAAAARVKSINPDCRVTLHRTFFLPEEKGQFDFSAFDYVVDAIDTVAGKIGLVMACHEAGTPIICAMGAGNKLDPSAFMVADISETSVCPLAKVMRRELKKRGIKNQKVVYSREEAIKPIEPGYAGNTETASCNAEPSEKEAAPVIPGKRQTPGSISFVPPVMGYIMAGEVIRDLIGYTKN